jgi:hypothetical protein
MVGGTARALRLNKRLEKARVRLISLTDPVPGEGRPENWNPSSLLDSQGSIVFHNYRFRVGLSANWRAGSSVLWPAYNSCDGISSPLNAGLWNLKNLRLRI